MEDIVEKIDKIIEKDDCWCIDYLPKQVEDWQKFAWLEKYLLTKKQKEQYADKIINIILKMIVYFESEFYIGDVYSKKLKKFQGYFKPETLKPKKLIDILKKMILWTKMTASTCCGMYFSRRIIR